MTVMLQSPLKGLAFTRFAIACAVAKGDLVQAQHIAAERWGTDSAPAMLCRAAVSGATFTDAVWAGPLNDYLSASAEFLSAVTAQSIIGKIPGLRRVPLNVQVIAQTGVTTGYWVGAGKPVPLSKAAFAPPVTLAPLKVAGLAVLTDALLRSSDPAAEPLIRADLIQACAKAIDQSFIDPANAGVTDEEPPSITNGIVPVVSSGDIDADLTALVEAFQGDLTRAVFIGTPETFAKLSGADHPGIGMRGGELLGAPAIASSNVPGGGLLALIDSGQVCVGLGAVEVRASKNASIEMTDAPTQDGVAGTGTTTLVSMFQCNSVALLAIQQCNWEAAPGAVAYLSGITSSGA